jgi:hypothetical protein
VEAQKTDVISAIAEYDAELIRLHCSSIVPAASICARSGSALQDGSMAEVSSAIDTLGQNFNFKPN